MGIIGKNTQSANSSGRDVTDPHRYVTNAGLKYTALANEEVFRIGIYVGANTGDGSGVEVGVYDGSGAANNSPLITAGFITELSANSLNTADIPPVALEEGVTYTVAYRVISATDLTLSRESLTGAMNNHSTLDGTSPLPATWSAGSSSSQIYTVWAETRVNGGPGPSIAPLAMHHQRQQR